MTDFNTILTALGPGATPPLLLFVIALYRRYIVLGWQYDALLADRDFWRGIALKSTDVAATSTSTSKHLAEKAIGE